MRLRGFFTMEAMIVALALSILAAAFGVCAQSRRLLVSSANLTTAACLAEKQLACVKGDSSLWGGEAEKTLPWQDARDQLPLRKNGMVFQVLTTLGPQTAEGLKAVEVAVSWREFGRPKQLKVSALLRLDE